ncbi:MULTISPECIES: molybdate ABC transporter substrate-binding protein [Streptomyces]|uniref:Molybdate ABC transporter substrate-binding protein n=1 Tax=Streptomyces mirabilis TaxID=68239 RepID=A0ABU3UPM4_9ACTN|nr:MULTISPECIES: molybdate ABC transporter substrate-binding protein [Streptomyces]MDU8995865.1 molybdate ABC transporter substrate-binding protein [Streptomyces mirabilis]QDN99614.1 molybdate ABC transporter substrate-binding protein [Streptomyces sp. RLB1-9]QDO21346.1 molybdate ABC transporter substrate-binding protein [Streptomyces sp. S1A1-8]QDO31470.1 molybdate ABC transporter substrate-binding protein [Streptomyces sp. S1A1-3]QDO41407.1 molybdate ABC transporter substrate-binding protein
MTRSTRRTRTRTLRVAGVGAAALLALSACSSSDSGSSSDSSPKSDTSASSSPKLSGTVTVFAAASLKESFTTLGKEFEKANPGTKVTFNFGGSDTLAASITGGAPADVFAAASPKTMAIVTDKKDAATTPATFVRNQLEIATLPGNPDKVASLKDLTKSGLKVVLCDKTVPCGAAAQKALDASKLKLTPVSYEQDVKSALTKVELKEADAAVVYKTDVKAAGDKVEGVEFPESAKAINAYPIALLKDAPNAEAAKAFIALVQSAEGQKVLTAAGFLQP